MHYSITNHMRESKQPRHTAAKGFNFTVITLVGKTEWNPISKGALCAVRGAELPTTEVDPSLGFR